MLSINTTDVIGPKKERSHFIIAQITITFAECFLCARHSGKFFLCIISFPGGSSDISGREGITRRARDIAFGNCW